MTFQPQSGPLAPVPRRKALLFLPIAIVGVVLRLAFLEARPLGEDEVRTLERATLSPAELVRDLEQSTHPPLYFLTAGGWASIAGAEIRPIRALSAVWGLATLALVVQVARLWAGADAALAAAFLLAISPIHVFYSQEARSYTMAGCLLLASTFLLVRWLSERGAGRGVAYVVVTTAAVYTHYWAFFVLPAHALVVAAHPRHSGGWIIAQCAIALLFALWIPVFVAQLHGGGGDWMPPAPVAAIPKTLYRWVAGYAVDTVVPHYRYFAILPFLVVYLPLLVLGIGAEDGESRDARLWRLALIAHLVVPLVVALAVSTFWKGMYLPGRFDMTVYPAFPLLAGRGLVRLPRRAVAPVVATVIVSAAVYLSFYWFATETWFRGTGVPTP